MESALKLLRSSDAFDRERGESELLRQGADALPALATWLEDTQDRILRLRAEQIFTQLLDGVIAELDRERQALLLDQREMDVLEARDEAAEIRQKLRPKIDAWKKEDIQIMEQIDSLVRLEALEKAEERAASGEGDALGEEAKQELERLRQVRSVCRSEREGFADAETDILRLARLEAAGGVLRPLSELERLRVEELKERITERDPAVATLARRLERLGIPALNGMLARRAASGTSLQPLDDAFLLKALADREEELLPPLDSPKFEVLRYSRALLWAWQVDRGGSLAARAEKALARHWKQTLRDLQSTEDLVKLRASMELYMHGSRGIKALEARLQDAGASEGQTERFLLQLLRWRIDPRTYARTGVDFRFYRDLKFRERRRKVFEYARAAREDAIPTLRAIVADENLEPSLFVRVGAAKALAGLGDMSGYEFLLLKHPNLTLTRPEVSRELAIIQGVEHIRAKQYEKAIDELKAVLEQSPFDFRANYHIAFAYLLLKDYPKAIRHFEIAKRVHPQDQLTVYNLACAYALSGKTTEALRELEAAVTAGFLDAAHIENDPDLESLRTEPAYKRILERLRQAVEENEDSRKTP